MGRCDKRRPIRRGAKGLELLLAEVDGCVALFCPALTNEERVIGADLADDPTNLLVRSPQKLLLGVHRTSFWPRAAWSEGRESIWLGLAPSPDAGASLKRVLKPAGIEPERASIGRGSAFGTAAVGGI
jgi:hypothetical protein